MRKNNATLLLLILASFILGAFSSQKFFANITADDVRKAAKIIGLEFSQPEIDSLRSGLDDLKKNYTANRAISIDNSVSPTLYFNPYPAGFKINLKNGAKGFSSVGDVKMPENKEELAYYSIPQLSALLKSKQITSVELTTFFIERLKKYDPKLKCVITLTEDLAMAQAKKADQEIQAGKSKGLLHGIPYGAKDLLAVEKYKTTWGAAPFKDQVLDYNATVIEKLEDAGAVLVAKLSMGALAWGDVWYDGKTRNPWDPESGSSGSSAGSASAVSAGLVPFAIGTETYGSIVSPSTVCGTTGLRPTFGRVSRQGAMALSWSMDKIGPICRYVEDAAIVFDAIKGLDPKDLSTINAPFNYHPRMLSVRGLKIGYVKSDFDKDYPFKEQDAQTLKVLRSLGYELVPVELPKLPDISFILEAEAAAVFDDLTRSGKDDKLVRQVKNAWPNVFRRSRFIPAVEYIQANRLRGQLIQDMQKVFEGIDVYISPSLVGDNLLITNLTGHPSVVIPNGFKDEKPTSITFTGNLLKEAEALAIAKVYQDRTGWHKKHPNLDE